MFVKPKDGLKVRDPVTMRHIPDAGMEVPETSFWMRRLADGDVSVITMVQIPDSGPAEETN